MSPAGEVVGRRARSAPEIQQPHPVLQLQKNVFGFVGTRKRDSGENARAVVRLLVAIRAEHVIICKLLVVVLEKVARLRCPLDQLALLELIQLVADLARVLRLSHQEKKYVMKNVVCYQQRDHDRHDQLKRQNNVQDCSCDRRNALKALGILTSMRSHGQAALRVIMRFYALLGEPLDASAAWVVGASLQAVLYV